MKYILVSDGSSDRALITIINFTLKQVFQGDFEGERADLGLLRKKPTELYEKILTAIKLYEPSFIFIHRDTEKETIQKRENEIADAISQVTHSLILQKKYGNIIPIRMTEAWLMIDEKAIRKAAGNPNGNVELSIPKINKLENISEPKDVLTDILKAASGLSGRRLRNLNTRQCIQLIPEYLEDFSPLEQLQSYQHFKRQVSQMNI